MEDGLNLLRKCLICFCGIRNGNKTYDEDRPLELYNNTIWKEFYIKNRYYRCISVM